MTPNRITPDFDYLAGVAQTIGMDWARTLRDQIAAGILIDMGDTDMRRATCPTHPGRIIENHACQVCGYTKPLPKPEPWQRTHAHLAVKRREVTVERPGQLDLNLLGQLEMSI